MVELVNFEDSDSGDEGNKSSLGGCNVSLNTLRMLKGLVGWLVGGGPGVTPPNTVGVSRGVEPSDGAYSMALAFGCE